MLVFVALYYTNCKQYSLKKLEIKARYLFSTLNSF